MHRRGDTTRRRRVLIWICGRLDTRGSFEDYLVRLCAVLAEAGFAIAVRAGPNCQPEVSRDLAGCGVQFASVPDAKLESLVQFARAVRTTRPDLVHCHFGSPSTRLAIVARLLGARRFVFTDHGSRPAPEGGTGLPERFKRMRRRALSTAVDLYLPVSGFVGYQLRRELGVPAHVVRTLMNGVDSDRFTPSRCDRGQARQALGLPPDGRCLMFVGQLIPQKGVADLLAAQPSLLDRFPSLHIVWVGDGPLRDMVARAAGPNVHVLGRRTDVAGLLPLADLVVAPSRWAEAFSLVLAEAASCGVATIATRVGGIPEVVAHGVTGLLVPPADPAALVEAIATLLADDARRARMGQAGRARACRLFSLDTVVAGTLGHYRRVLHLSTEFDRMTVPAAAETAEEAAAALARDGIARLPALLSAESLAGLCQSFERALARPSFNTWLGYEQNEKWRRLVENLLMLDPAAFTLALHPLVTGAIARHVGPGFALTEARGWKTIATRRNFHGWHSDAWSHASLATAPREVKLGVYLTDVTSGHFSYIAASHAPYHRPRHWSAAEVAPMLSRRVDVLGPAGTAFLFDTAGVHRQSTPVLTPRNVLFFNYHDPSVRLQDEDVRAGRYRPLALNAGFAPDLSVEECRVLGFGRARDRPATEAVVGRAAMRRYPGLHDAVAIALAARLEWQELQRILRRGRSFLVRRARRLLPATPPRRVPAGE